jgi:hypothetical protein
VSPAPRFRAPARAAAAAAAACLALAGPLHGAGPDRPRHGLGFPDPTTDALVSQLRRALVNRPGGDHDRLLAALRSLRDPGLTPLFAQLAAGQRPLLRVHGILGLAELESPPRVDLLLVKRIADPEEQAVILTLALKSGLLEPERLQDVVRWPGLGNGLLAMAIGTLHRSGAPADLEPLRRIAAGTEEAAAIIAALELVQAGEEPPPAGAAEGETPDPRATALARVVSLDPSSPRGAQTVVLVADYIREQRLTRLDGLLRTLWNRCDASAPCRVETARALLSIAPGDPRTIALWQRTYAGEDLAGRIRLGLGALEAALQRRADCPAAAFEPLSAAGEAPLLRAMGAAGAAVVTDGSVVSAVVHLVEQRHRLSSEWALALAATRPPDEALPIRLAVLGAARGVLRAQPELFDAATRAAADLAPDAPDAWRDALRDAVEAGDEPCAAAILAGALHQGRAAGLADRAAPILAGRAGALPSASALLDLLRARDNPGLSPADFDRLSRIALGVGSLAEAYRVQAAWLALKCRGEQRVALARVLADEP